MKMETGGILAQITLFKKWVQLPIKIKFHLRQNKQRTPRIRLHLTSSFQNPEIGISMTKPPSEEEIQGSKHFLMIQKLNNQPLTK